ncbi:hypothetical protein M569_13359, partial [Genlisea aurea]
CKCRSCLSKAFCPRFSLEYHFRNLVFCIPKIMTKSKRAPSSMIKRPEIHVAFGFITFKDIESAHSALRSPHKMIDGRVAVCNLAAEGLNRS